MSETIDLTTLTEVRVCGVRDDPETQNRKTAVLQMTSDYNVTHFVMTLADLEVLVAKLTQDLKLLQSKKPGRLS